jgi:hypothetical protein
MRTTPHLLSSDRRTLLCGILLLAATSPAPGQSTVYRCTAPDGSIEFRQHPCRSQDTERALAIPDNRTGWVPPQPEPPPKHKPAAKAKRRSGTPDADRYADRCWKKRQQVEGINNELRAGYTPARGEGLKRRRREYEAYLNRYCR